ncbi:hypothetical protein TBLA_0I02310 [Henningerozyma blattae CBS 6284]|uniref:Uncharacterized protein n=1 Tax=Henningerozyma blattae (strain ATCC 34711 / CBS 6284 / DSM 70876 / NBRC 10599 / NRRL Y-10934 / UCD 77-7) TaxID=1071380 RepID=I2H937_HENB6|nr:hypothetical protein TBLA_0I02310 [Tetrapisispora blattae CBS 6284]CCH62889.1 hypothetical protein TBLA_0I02310 [Tetrapisispora blattae CBS 6284]
MNFEELKAKGNISFKNGSYSEAISWYNRCISIDPSNPIGYSNKAMALLKADRFDEAITTCEKGLQLISKEDPENLIKQKLEYRLQSAKSSLRDYQKNYIPIEINEVDELHSEFSSL